jgi:hypothetical protein
MIDYSSNVTVSHRATKLGAAKVRTITFFTVSNTFFQITGISNKLYMISLQLAWKVKPF